MSRGRDREPIGPPVSISFSMPAGSPYAAETERSPPTLAEAGEGVGGGGFGHFALARGPGREREALLHFVKAGASTWGGALSDRVGRRRAILLGLGVYAIAYAGFAVAGSPLQVGFLFAFYGLFHALTEGAERALVADLAGGATRGRAFGLFSDQALRRSPTRESEAQMATTAPPAMASAPASHHHRPASSVEARGRPTET